MSRVKSKTGNRLVKGVAVPRTVACLLSVVDSGLKSNGVSANAELQAGV